MSLRVHPVSNGRAARAPSATFGGRRLLDVFERHNVQTTFFAAGRALERNPELGPMLRELRHEPSSHGYRSREHFAMSKTEERLEIRAAVAAIERCVGVRPVGWYCRYGPGTQTRRLLAEEGGFLYDSDAYNADLPSYTSVGGRPVLPIPGRVSRAAAPAKLSRLLGPAHA